MDLRLHRDSLGFIVLCRDVTRPSLRTLNACYAATCSLQPRPFKPSSHAVYARFLMPTASENPSRGLHYANGVGLPSDNNAQTRYSNGVREPVETLQRFERFHEHSFAVVQKPRRGNHAFKVPAVGPPRILNPRENPPVCLPPAHLLESHLISRSKRTWRWIFHEHSTQRSRRRLGGKYL